MLVAVGGRGYKLLWGSELTAVIRNTPSGFGMTRCRLGLVCDEETRLALHYVK